MTSKFIPALVCMAMLSACGSSQQSADTEKKKQGREETQGIRNTDAIGMSGSAISNNVDKALNANDQHNQKIDEGAKAVDQ